MTDGRRYIIEIKPSQLSPLNESDMRKNPTMYKNACKWNAAVKWCKANNYIFKVITEKNLKP
jgi:hypothetical protein